MNTSQTRFMPLLLLFGTLLLGLAGCQDPSIGPDEAVAVNTIQRLGGKVEFDGQGNDRRVIKVYLHDSLVKDADLPMLEKLPRLRNLFLGRTSIGDKGLEHLRKCENLQTVALNSTRVTDAGLKLIADLKKLKTINLKETSVTAEGVSRLRKALPEATIAR